MSFLVIKPSSNIEWLHKNLLLSLLIKVVSLEEEERQEDTDFCP